MPEDWEYTFEVSWGCVFVVVVTVAVWAFVIAATVGAFR